MRFLLIALVAFLSVFSIGGAALIYANGTREEPRITSSIEMVD